VLAWPAPIPPPLLLGLPPVDEHDAIPMTRTLAPAIAANRLNFIRFSFIECGATRLKG
jgi:hypothetical protein